MTDKKAKDRERQKTGVTRLSFYSLMKVCLIVGSVNTVTNMPFDVAKTHLQKHTHETGGVFSILGKIFRERGVSGLYAGWSVGITKYMIQSTIIVTILNKLQQRER